MTQATFPLLHGGRAIESQGKTIGFSLDINLVSAPYLPHHSFPMGDTMPATVVLEYMLELALWYGKTYQNHTCRTPLQVTDFVIERTFILPPGGEQTVDVMVETVADNSLTLSFGCLRVNKKGKVLGKRQNATATVSFTDSYCDVELRDELDDFLSQPVKQTRFSQSELYGYLLQSHGEWFQSMTNQFSLNNSNTCLLGDYDCGNKERHWLPSGDSNFVLSPLGLDSCLQYNTTLSILHDGFPRLPVGIEALTLHQPHPKSGVCRVFVRYVSGDDQQAFCDLMVLDSEDNPVLTAKGISAKTHSATRPGNSTLTEWLVQNTQQYQHQQTECVA